MRSRRFDDRSRCEAHNHLHIGLQSAWQLLHNLVAGAQWRYGSRIALRAMAFWCFTGCGCRRRRCSGREPEAKRQEAGRGQWPPPSFVFRRCDSARTPPLAVARGVIVWLGKPGQNQARLLRESQQAFLQRINNPAWVELRCNGPRLSTQHSVRGLRGARVTAGSTRWARWAVRKPRRASSRRCTAARGRTW